MLVEERAGVGPAPWQSGVAVDRAASELSKGPSDLQILITARWFASPPSLSTKTYSVQPHN